SPDGKLLATGGLDRTVKLWDLETYRVVRTFPPQPAFISALAFSPDGKTLAVGTGGLELKRGPGEVKLWDVATGREGGVLLRRAEGVTALAFFPDGKTLAVGTNAVLSRTQRGELLLYDVTAKKVKQRFSELVDVKSLAIGPGGTLLAAGDGVGTVMLWDLKAATPRRLAGHDHSLTGPA